MCMHARVHRRVILHCADDGNVQAPGTCDGAPSTIGEGGAVYALGTSNHVVMLHYHTIYHSAHGGQNMTRVVLPSSANDHSSVLQYTRAVGSRYEPAGDVYTVMTMAPSDNWRSRDDDDDKYLKYMVYGEQRDVRVGGPWADRDDGAWGRNRNRMQRTCVGAMYYVDIGPGQGC